MLPGLGKVNLQDLVKSVLTAVIVAVIVYLNSVVQAGTFDPTTIDWAYLLDISLKAGCAELIRRLATTADGKFLGTIKTN